DDGFAVHDVVSPFIGGKKGGLAWRPILQQLDSRPALRPEGRNQDARAQYVVEGVLLGALVFAFSDHLHTHQGAVKAETGFSIPDHDCSVVDPQEQFTRGAMPLGEALVGRKLKNLEWMTILIFEVEGANAGSVLVPVGKALRTRRSMLNLILAQPCISPIHVTYDDGDVLKGSVITSGINWNRAPLWRKVLSQRYELVPNLQAYNPCPHSENTFQVLVAFSR